MICLDTNYLILGLVQDSAEAKALIAWHASGEALVTSSIAWYEFLCGPVDELQTAVMRNLLSGTIPFGHEQASTAAQLFNATGRRRKLRVDAMIAATAITAGAKLATNNAGDFEPFAEHGLHLI